MSVQATSWVWDHSASKGSTRLVLLAIADAANREGKRSCQSAASISRMAGVSQRTVWRAISELENLGEIRNVGTNGQYQTSVYELCAMPDCHSDKLARRDNGGDVVVPNELVVVPPIGTQPHKTPKETPSSRGSRVDENFKPSEQLAKWARENTPNVDIRLETAQFVDHHVAKGSTMKDWNRAWQTWMRNQQKWSKPAAPQQPVPSQYAWANG